MNISGGTLIPFDRTVCDKDGDHFYLRKKLTNGLLAQAHRDQIPAELRRIDAIHGYMYAHHELYLQGKLL